MFIPPWAWAKPVPPDMEKAWIKATAGAALAVLMTGAYFEQGRLQDVANEIAPLSPKQVQVARPELSRYFTELNREQAIEACYWRNTPDARCAEAQEVAQVVSALRQDASLANIGGLILGVGAIGALASALRRPTAP